MSSHPKLDEKEVADRLQQLGFDTNDPEKVRERERERDARGTFPTLGRGGFGLHAQQNR